MTEQLTDEQVKLLSKAWDLLNAVTIAHCLYCECDLCEARLSCALGGDRPEDRLNCNVTLSQEDA